MSLLRLAPDQLNTLTPAELDRWEYQLSQDDLDISRKIDESQDPDWVRRAAGARRAIRVNLDRVRRRRSDLRKQEWARKVTATDTFLAAFHEAAREMLTDGLYAKVVAKATVYHAVLEQQQRQDALMGDVKARTFQSSANR